MSRDDEQELTTPAMVIAALADAWNTGDVDVIDQFVAPDHRQWSSSGWRHVPPAQLKDELAAIRSAFPDLHASIVEQLVDGPRIATACRLEGTHRGAFLGVPPTNRACTTTFVSFALVQKGKLVEHLSWWDRFGLLSSIGIGEAGSNLTQEASELYPTVAAEDVRAFHRRFVTGATVVTTQSREGPCGLAVNAFTSVSLDPPRILVCIARSSATHAKLFESDRIGVNILSEEQAWIAQRFARSGIDKFAGVPWHLGPFDCPMIDGSSAQLEAAIEERTQASTHTMFLCRVLAATHSEHPPLVYSGGTLYPSSLLAAADATRETR